MAQLMSLLVQNAILVVFVASFAARLGLPVPAAAVLVVTGALLAAGDVSVVGVVLAAVIANLLGDGAWFYAGRRFGYRFMRLLCRISLSPDSCVRRGESLISDWGGMSLVAAKFVPGVSVVAPPMAGALGMSVRRFIGFDVGAALVWIGCGIVVGRGDHAGGPACRSGAFDVRRPPSPKLRANQSVAHALMAEPPGTVRGPLCT